MEYNNDFEVRKAILEAYGVDPYVENGNTVYDSQAPAPTSAMYIYDKDGYYLAAAAGKAITDGWEFDTPEELDEWLAHYEEGAIVKFGVAGSYCDANIDAIQYAILEENGIHPEAGDSIPNSVYEQLRAATLEHVKQVDLTKSYRTHVHCTETIDNDASWPFEERDYIFWFDELTEEEVFNYTHDPRSLNNTYEVDLAILGAIEEGGGGGGGGSTITTKKITLTTADESASTEITYDWKVGIDETISGVNDVLESVLNG